MSKGGRRATADDLDRLTGLVDGVPCGLACCASFGENGGECLDSSGE